ncbi:MULTISPECIES: BRO family protein [Streptomyces]|uniref:DNA-binding protein n=1 Tax=Streptomyces venezuelae TaxID=54571 RepID=A0A5P2AS02_STRVZ|nr:BRO family protein [Streptomyces venezuelae]QES20963.1 DNA-binding protein [Streptomyces venezuelae]
MDAIDIDDMVYVAIGTRPRRLTAPDGTHWFPVVDVAKRLGYPGTREALRTVVLPEWCLARAGELAGSTAILALSGVRASARMVNVPGLVQLVAACRRPEAAPFRAWVAEVVAAVQRDGGYGLEPSPVHAGFLLPPELLDALVRLEGEFDEQAAVYAAYEEHADRAELLRETRENLARAADSLARLAVPRQRTGAAVAALTPRQLVESWAITGDTRTVASCLAPALVRGGVRYRPQDVTLRTGLSGERVSDCVRILLERGCMREVGSPDPDGARIYVLP